MREWGMCYGKAIKEHCRHKTKDAKSLGKKRESMAQASHWTRIREAWRWERRDWWCVCERKTESESKVCCRTKWPEHSLPNIKSIDTISVRPPTAESIKKKFNDSSVKDAAWQHQGTWGIVCAHCADFVQCKCGCFTDNKYVCVYIKQAEFVHIHDSCVSGCVSV